MVFNPYTKKRRISVEGEHGPGQGQSADRCVGDSSTASTPTESASALVIAASDKAGMDGIDRAKIDAIILRESGSSLYMQQQRKRDQQVDQRIEQLRQKLKEEEEKHPNWRLKIQKSVDDEVDGILAKRPIRSACVVVDMDMFYMACELLTRPDLVDKPACVGGSMITTSNYVARKYGVRSAMAGYIGDKLVEELSGGREKLIHVKSNFALYKEKSAIVRQVLAEFDPNLRAYSLDEAFMDLAPYLALKMTRPQWTHEQIKAELARQGDAEEKLTTDTSGYADGGLGPLDSFPASACMSAASEVIAQMRAMVQTATGGLTCSAGLAPNFMLAKIASDRNKPDGQCLVASDHGSIIQFLHPLPTRKVPGIGRVSAKTLQAFGIQTVADLQKERAVVRFLFKPTTAAFLLRASLGCSSSDDKATDEEHTGQKGISRERTFRSGQSWTEINSRLEDIAHLLSSDMAKKEIWARTLTVKVKLHTFDVHSRARSMARGVYLHEANGLAKHAAEILREIRDQLRKSDPNQQFNVRLLGIRCSNFRSDEDSGQGSIEKFLQPKAATTPLQSAAKATPAAAAKAQAITPTIDDKTPPRASIAASTSPKDDDAPPTIFVCCPVCGQEFPETKNRELNQHIDACLSGRVVRSVLREQSKLNKPVPGNTANDPKNRRKRRITDFW